MQLEDLFPYFTTPCNNRRHCTAGLPLMLWHDKRTLVLYGSILEIRFYFAITPHPREKMHSLLYGFLCTNLFAVYTLYGHWTHTCKHGKCLLGDAGSSIVSLSAVGGKWCSQMFMLPLKPTTVMRWWHEQCNICTAPRLCLCSANPSSLPLGTPPVLCKEILDNNFINKEQSTSLEMKVLIVAHQQPEETIPLGSYILISHGCWSEWEAFPSVVMTAANKTAKNSASMTINADSQEAGDSHLQQISVSDSRILGKFQGI